MKTKDTAATPARLRLSEHKRVVVKIGTTSLTYANGQLNLQQMEKICRVLSDLCNQGREMILVTSGAIAVGAGCLNLGERPRDIRGKQAASAVGQAMLMQIYQQFFSMYNRRAAQILLTQDVLDVDIRKVNARNTFDTLLSMGVVPIVNANDTIATDELDDISDNDRLSAHVAVISQSNLLIMLSDIAGLYDADPKTKPDATIFHDVHEITPEIEAVAGGAGSLLGTGGMATKIQAARIAMPSGIDSAIASGDDPAVLWKLLSGEQVGTVFYAK